MPYLMPKLPWIFFVNCYENLHLSSRSAISGFRRFGSICDVLSLALQRIFRSTRDRLKHQLVKRVTLCLLGCLLTSSMFFVGSIHGGFAAQPLLATTQAHQASSQSTVSSELQAKNASPSRESIKPETSSSAASSLALNVLLSITTSLLASILFWTFLYNRRPRIKVSPWIIRHRTNGTIDYYLVKIVNESRTDLVGIKYEAYHVMPLPSEWIDLPDGKQKEVRLMNKKRLKLGMDGLRTDSMVLKRYVAPSQDPHGEALYAQVLSLKVQHQDGVSLDEMLQSHINSYIVFSVYAIHPASGFGKVFSKVFNQGHIVDGCEFKWGSSLEHNHVKLLSSAGPRT